MSDLAPTPDRPPNPTREGEAPAERGAPNDARLRRSAVPLKRRHPTHGIKYVEGQPTIIFDTICVQQRQQVLACDAFHNVFRDVVRESTAWVMGRYVIMPDHIHFFAADVGNAIAYENWVTYLKSQLTKACRKSRRQAPTREGEAPAEPPRTKRCTAPQERRPPIVSAIADFRWLTDHWDARVRNADVYELKWQYVLYNPVRAGFVERPEDWPYQGEIYELRWR